MKKKIFLKIIAVLGFCSLLLAPRGGGGAAPAHESTSFLKRIYELPDASTRDILTQSISSRGKLIKEKTYYKNLLRDLLEEINGAQKESLKKRGVIYLGKRPMPVFTATIGNKALSSQFEGERTTPENTPEYFKRLALRGELLAEGEITKEIADYILATGAVVSSTQSQVFVAKDLRVTKEIAGLFEHIKKAYKRVFNTPLRSQAPDFTHGHFFGNIDKGVVGIIFHAFEYYPYNLVMENKAILDYALSAEDPILEDIGRSQTIKPHQLIYSNRKNKFKTEQNVFNEPGFIKNGNQLMTRVRFRNFVWFSNGNTFVFDNKHPEIRYSLYDLTPIQWNLFEGAVASPLTLNHRAFTHPRKALYFNLGYFENLPPGRNVIFGD